VARRRGPAAARRQRRCDRAVPANLRDPLPERVAGDDGARRRRRRPTLHVLFEPDVRRRSGRIPVRAPTVLHRAPRPLRRARRVRLGRRPPRAGARQRRRRGPTRRS
jgi:hypothetical protein